MDKEAEYREQDDSVTLKCKYIKREGESCRLNNNCTYPDCEIENLHRSVQSVK